MHVKHLVRSIVDVFFMDEVTFNFHIIILSLDIVCKPGSIFHLLFHTLKYVCMCMHVVKVTYGCHVILP